MLQEAYPKRPQKHAKYFLAILSVTLAVFAGDK